MKNLKIFLAVIFTAFSVCGYAQTNVNAQSVRFTPGKDTATFSPQPNGTLLSGNSGQLWYKNATQWIKISNQSGSSGWPLTGIGTLTGAVNMVSNARRQYLFNGSWTATANYDYNWNFAGSFTGRASQTNDLLWGYKFQPTLTRGASSPNQTLTGVLIQPVFAGSGDLNNYGLTVVDGKVLFKNGGKYAPSIGAGVEIQDSTHNANGADMDFYAPLATVVNDRIYELHGYNNNSLGVKTQMVADFAENVSNTSGAEGGRRLMNITTNGTLKEYFNAQPDGSSNVTLALVSSGATSGKRVLFNGTNYSLTLGQVPSATSYLTTSNNPATQMLGGLANYSTNAASFGEWTIANDQSLSRAEGIGLLSMPSAFPTFNAFRPSGTALFSGSNKTGGMAIVMASSTGNIRWYTGGETASELRGTITAGGLWGWRQNTPTAYFHLGAGTATANTAPLKFTSGTVLATEEAGTVQYDGSNFWFNTTSTVGDRATISPTQLQLTLGAGTQSTLSTQGLTWNAAAGNVAITLTGTNNNIILQPSSGSTTGQAQLLSGNSNLGIKVSNNDLIFLVTRTSCSGAPTGAIANVAGVLNICP